MGRGEIDREELKKLAVEGALEWIEEHYDLNRELRVGVGSGSTVAYSFSWFANYPEITAVPTSSETMNQLKELGVRTDRLAEEDKLLFDLDGADEVDPNLNLIKGGGGCHYREKKVADRSKSFFIVVDQTKLVDYLGQKYPLPVEVEPKSTEKTSALLASYGEPAIRKDDTGLFRTDNGNFIIDLELKDKLDEDELIERERDINEIDGVIENGFFVRRKADIVFVGTEDGIKIIGDESE